MPLADVERRTLRFDDEAFREHSFELTAVREFASGNRKAHACLQILSQTWQRDRMIGRQFVQLVQ